MILDLILDIRCHIASRDETVWMAMYRYDPEFRAYAKSTTGISEFKKNFNTMILYNSIKKWYLLGRLHREGKPAIIYDPNLHFTLFHYYINGALHRDDDKPAIIYANGTVEYYKHGLRHRSRDADGKLQPAYISLTLGGEYWIDGVFQGRYDATNQKLGKNLNSVG